MPPKRKRETIPFNPHTVNGPGVWVTFVRGRDHQAASELIDLFDEASLAAELWPPEAVADDANAEATASGGIDDELAAELAELKAESKQKRKLVKDRRFNAVLTDVECVFFLLCKTPVDPLKLVLAYFERVEKTKVTKLRYVQRLIPIQHVCPANLEHVAAQARKIVELHLPSPTTYRVEAHIRSHGNLQKEEVMQAIVGAIPKDGTRTVDFKDPAYTLFCTVFKSVSMMASVPDMGRWSKYNPNTIATKDTAAEKNEKE
ncbi:hypothetical protein EXIGLDRAFT_770660 [Exidia glandulosa HHB12029]|uniref:THUMP domain-containing protein n=1 Tax=Exidia glandulosa HHB12029 TaxID=1314781 RepID=A0A165GJA6_EXIGL|nr:hypothetical protein EXIGLDRAFT_770660 [Exidia glandulosa HHB12029]